MRVLEFLRKHVNFENILKIAWEEQQSRPQILLLV